MSVIYHPKFERSAKVLSFLSSAAAIRAWIDQRMVDVSWIPSIQRQALARLAHHSTRIEGNPLTLPEVEALAEGKELFVEERAKREVLNYFAALRWIWRKNSPDKIQESDLLKLHAILTAGILPQNQSGAYKILPNAVVGGGRIIYKPPPPEAAPILTKSLLAWINSKSSQEEHAVITAAIAHHRLASIHPFMDGNGRAARALETWILCRRGFDTHHIFALDEFFEQDRPRYYREIQQVREQGDNLTPWLEYVSEGILETLRKTQMRIQKLRPVELEKKIILSPGQERVLQILAAVPRMGGGELARSLGITRSALSKMIQPMLQAKLIVKEGSTRAAAYRLAQ